MSPMRTDLASDARSMARGAMINLAGIAAASALALAFNLVAVRLVPVGRFGLYALAVTIVTLAQVPALLGLDTATVRFVAIGAERQDARAVSGSIQTALVASTVTGVAVAVALWWEATWICSALFNKPSAAGMVRIIAVSLPALVAVRVIVSGIQGLGLMRRTAWLAALRMAAALILVLLVAAAGFSTRGLAVAWAAAAWVTLVAALITLYRVHAQTYRPVPDAWRFRSMLWFAIPQTLTGMLFLAVVWTDTLMVAHYRRAADIAVYAVAVRLITPCTAVATAISQMFSPRIAADSVRGDRASLGVMLQRVTRWNTMLSMPIFLGLIVIPSALLAMFGSRYTAGAEALVILAVGQLINTAAGPLGQVINMSGRPYLSMCNNGLVAIVNVIMCVALIPAYGLSGAALATTVALTLVNLIKIAQVRRLYGALPFNTDTIKVLGAGGIAALAASGVSVIAAGGDMLRSLLVVPALLTLTYVVTIRALGISSDDRDVLSAAGARLRALRHLSTEIGGS